MAWVYEQLTGNLLQNGTDLIAKGYSGKGDGVNNPDMQNVANVGPIPVGWYTVGEPYNSDHGPYTLRLTSDLTNEMYGRSGFLMHGDRVDSVGKRLASEGCIIMPRSVREMVWNSSNHFLQVVSGLTSV